MIVLQFSANRSLGSRAIVGYTRLLGHTAGSDETLFSHVDFVLPNNQLLGALANGGVQVHGGRRDYTRVQRFLVRGAPDSVLDLALTQIGKPYDWTAIFGIGFNRNWQEDDAWECAEMAAWCCMQKGRPLLRAAKASRITPPMLALSPLLEPEPAP